MNAPRQSVLGNVAKQWSIVAIVGFGTMLVVAAKSAHSMSPLLALVLLAPLGVGIAAQKARATRADLVFALVLNGSLFGYAVLDAIRSYGGAGGPLRTIVSLALLAAPALLHLVVLYPRAALSSRS